MKEGRISIEEERLFPKTTDRIEAATERVALRLTREGNLIDRARQGIQQMPIEQVVQVSDQLEAARHHWSSVAEGITSNLWRIYRTPPRDIVVCGELRLTVDNTDRYNAAGNQIQQARKRVEIIDQSPVTQAIHQRMEQEFKEREIPTGEIRTSSNDSPFLFIGTSKDVLFAFIVEYLKQKK